MKRLIGFELTLAIVALAGATDVEANCIPAQTIGSYYYWLFNDDTETVANFVGQFWQTGSKSTMNQGTMPLSDWFFGVVGYLTDPQFSSTR